MDHLFSPQLTDLGPCALAVDPVPPPLCLVQGKRSAQLRSEVRRLCPRKPGSYAMLDREGEIIYIGKAKCLRARLLSYFRRRSRDPKAGRILAQTKGIGWETSPNEFAALHRELELIRRWRPRWNVQGQPQRRRLTFVCLGRAPAPYVYLARHPSAKALASFGPIPLGERARQAVRRLNDCFQLRDCPQFQEMVFADQAQLFPGERSPGCLRYELGTCLGPCFAACTEDAYGRKARAVRHFLSGADKRLLESLHHDMAAAAAAEQFERATVLRDKLASLQWLLDRLERMRRLREEESFIYPLKGHDRKEVWYLIHGGRTVATIAAPIDTETRRTARRRIEEVYRRNPAHLLDGYEHWDNVLLVAAWFRRYPEERKRGMEPREAQARTA
jgi:excinuclease ABC subunit C